MVTKTVRWKLGARHFVDGLNFPDTSKQTKSLETRDKEMFLDGAEIRYQGNRFESLHADRIKGDF